ncbi:MAG TPA: efflux RND transporter periplasmic adaptor subunit [Anaeromyxobacteraceae bacterium]|nr:efflux RND transporter periplasmic adaptor subunit [Anaeromyxobacteraceae bacterium]
MSWTKRAVTALLVLLVAGMVALSLRPRTDPPLEVQVVEVRQGPITRRVTGAGKLQAATQVKLSSNLSGDLLDLTVREGDRVQKGQYLGRIDSRRYAAQVSREEAARATATAEVSLAEVQAARSKAELERVKRLVKSQSASEAELEKARSDADADVARLAAARDRVAQATAALADARHLLSYTTLVSPIDGVITSRQKQVGERVRGSDFNEDVIVIVATLSSMEMKAEVGEHEVVHLREGQAAEVEVDAFPDKKWPAQVVEIAKNATIKNPGTEAEVTTFPVRLALTAQLPGGLPGMSGQATVSTETHDDAVVVPLQAVTARTERDLKGDGGPRGEPDPPPDRTGQRRREPMQKLVFVVDKGVARVRSIETGLASETEIEILSGVKKGELVVEGPYKTLSRELRDGRAVKYQPAAKAGPDGGPEVSERKGQARPAPGNGEKGS